MQSAEIRDDRWVWVPLRPRRSRVWPTVVIAGTAAAAGYMVGRHADKAEVAPQPTIVAVSPTADPEVENSKAYRTDAGGKPELALKGDDEIAQHSPALTQPKPEAPPVVLINPGSANSKGTVEDPAIVHKSRTSAAHSSGSDVNPMNGKPRAERKAGSHSSIQDYRGLRDYMLGRK